MVSVKRLRKRANLGLTLMEVALAMSIVVCAVTGASAMRFHTTRQNKKAAVYNSAVRVAEVFLESWLTKSEPGTFDPYSIANDLSGSKISFDSVGTASGPVVPVGLNLLGGTYYLVIFDGIHYYVTMAYRNSTATSPSLLSVGVGWRNNYDTGTFAVSNQVVWLTTYD